MSSLVAGSGYPFTHALIQLDEGLLPKLGDPSVKSEITAAFKRLLATTNEEIEEFEKIGFVVVVKDRWTVEGGQLTPTMKIKRGPIEDMYKDKLEAWYAAGQEVIWE